jgi:hypothetical protein
MLLLHAGLLPSHGMGAKLDALLMAWEIRFELVYL